MLVGKNNPLYIIKVMIREYYEKNEKPMPRKELLEECEFNEIPLEKATMIINKLLVDGDIYEPNKGFYRAI